VELVDLQAGRGELDRPEAPRRVVLLPGIRYPTTAPLLWFTRAVAAARGWGTLGVAGVAAGDPDPLGWTDARARAALDHAPAAETVLVGKSLGTTAAGLAAERGLAAIWLTPLLDREEVAAAISASTAPTLLVGGTADPTWVPGAVPGGAPFERLELEGLDHALQREGDVAGSLDALREVTRAVDGFLAARERDR
jgi:hypothetical protein